MMAPSVKADGPQFVNIINPIRGQDTWNIKDQKISDPVKGQKEILQKNNLNATWLIRYDALSDTETIALLKNNPQGEIGLFLEVTPSWTKDAKVSYRQSGAWHLAESVFLTGYTQQEREKLIDSAFEKFKVTFGTYPSSVGAWWVDAYSLSYMQEKYKIKSNLFVADQFSTDNYQIWGQYFGVPYYPDKTNALIPAQSEERKLNLVMFQWAARDPLNGYGDGVQESTYSVQANDYIDFHDLDNKYFSKLVDVYLDTKFNRFGQITVGLENSYEWKKYRLEYQKQIEDIAARSRKGVRVVTMSQFADWYRSSFPEVSPDHIIATQDLLGSQKYVVWYMNPYYRTGWFYDQNGSNFRDIRQYIAGNEEICFKEPCKSINFATSSVRVLDDVTYKQRWVLDPGKVKDIKVTKVNAEYKLSYTNEAERPREIIFMPRDLSFNGEVKTIDGAILNALTLPANKLEIQTKSDQVDKYRLSPLQVILNVFKFVIFLVLALFIPGLILVKETGKVNFFLSISVGLVCLTAVSLIAGLLKIDFVIYLFILLCLIIFLIKRLYRNVNLKLDLSLSVIILLGSIFQGLTSFKSGWVYGFGIGFWGPTGHDGIWHQALINQLMVQVPPNNPGFSGFVLSNYHYFFDLLVAVTAKITQIPVLDLLYRFYPILFSALLGLGSYQLGMRLFKNRAIALIGLFFVYFGGSFGFIAQLIKTQELGGESAFWMNQPVSMNLNPPFAISLILIIAVLLLLEQIKQKQSLFGMIALTLVIGLLIEFKVYAALLVFIALGFLSIKDLFKRSFKYLSLLVVSLAISLIVFLPQKSTGSDLLIWYPFWFINAMIDNPDRVGWVKLTQARLAYFQRGEYPKFILVELLSMFIYIVGNLGTRIISILVVLKNIKKIFNNDLNLFIFIFTTASFLIPIFLLQKGNLWNTIQFSYYGLYFAGLFAAPAIYFLAKRLWRPLAVVIIALILITTPLSSFATFRSGFYPSPPSRLTFGELEALSFLKEKPHGIVLTYPYKRYMQIKEGPYPLFVYESTAYVSAFSGKPTFLEDEIQQEILQMDYQKRYVQELDFFKVQDKKALSFLEENHIRYIYLLKAYNQQLSIDSIGFKTIFENDDVVIYEKVN